jgi:hypothetical protein
MNICTIQTHTHTNKDIQIEMHEIKKSREYIINTFPDLLCLFVVDTTSNPALFSRWMHADSYPTLCFVCIHD